ncbi:MAG: hypothetical protein ACLSFT_01650 [Ruminococcus callidus]
MTFSYAIDADDESSGNADVPVNKGVTHRTADLPAKIPMWW